MSHMIKFKRRSQGFTLIEVLVTMLILAVGLLGIAALQLKGLQFNHDAAMRSQISTLAYDIADRIRLSNSVNSALPASYLGNYQSGNAGACDQTVYPDSAADVTTDLNCWHQAVDSALPPGSNANVAYDAAQDEYTVTLGWSDREGQSHDVLYTFSLL